MWRRAVVGALGITLALTACSSGDETAADSGTSGAGGDNPSATLDAAVGAKQSYDVEVLATRTSDLPPWTDVADLVIDGDQLYWGTRTGAGCVEERAAIFEMRKDGTRAPTSLSVVERLVDRLAADAERIYWTAFSSCDRQTGYLRWMRKGDSKIAEARMTGRAGQSDIISTANMLYLATGETLHVVEKATLGMVSLQAPWKIRATTALGWDGTLFYIGDQAGSISSIDPATGRESLLVNGGVRTYRIFNNEGELVFMADAHPSRLTRLRLPGGALVTVAEPHVFGLRSLQVRRGRAYYWEIVERSTSEVPRHLVLVELTLANLARRILAEELPSSLEGPSPAMAVDDSYAYWVAGDRVSRARTQ